MKPGGFFSIKCVLLMIAGSGWSAGVFGQLPAGSPGGVNAALTVLFGSTNGFTARVEAQVLDARRQESLRMPMQFAASDSRIRVEIDVSQVHSRELSLKQVNEMKDAGLGRIVSIIRPDKKASYILYPGVQTYSVVPMPKAEVDALASHLKIQKTALGKETLEGHPCVKHHFLATNNDRTVLDAITWNATDLKDFPIRIQTQNKSGTSILSFRDIQFKRPDPGLFEIPGRYKLSG